MACMFYFASCMNIIFNSLQAQLVRYDVHTTRKMFITYYYYLRNHLWEFHRIYNFSAVGDKDEVIRFRGQKVKGQGHSKTTYGQISTFWPISGMHEHIFMKLLITSAT